MSVAFAGLNLQRIQLKVINAKIVCIIILSSSKKNKQTNKYYKHCFHFLIKMSVGQHLQTL